MVAGYHLIWTIYGAWLPNDPRGSNSIEIRSPILEELGEIHYGRKRIQPCGAVIRKFYQQAKPKLKYEIVPFAEDEIQLIATVFDELMKKQRYTCYGCAIMPDHVHILLRKHRHQAEDMIGNLQEATSDAISQLKRRPGGHPIWGGPGWKVYLESHLEIERTIRYIRANPIKAGVAEQVWDFVQAYDGWLPGGGMDKSRTR